MPLQNTPHPLTLAPRPATPPPPSPGPDTPRQTTPRRQHPRPPPTRPAPQFRVANPSAVISALAALPGGWTTSPDVPDLQPRFAGGRPPAPGAERFTIASWQVRTQPPARLVPNE